MGQGLSAIALGISVIPLVGNVINGVKKLFNWITGAEKAAEAAKVADTMSRTARLKAWVTGSHAWQQGKEAAESLRETAKEAAEALRQTAKEVKEATKGVRQTFKEAKEATKEARQAKKAAKWAKKYKEHVSDAGDPGTTTEQTAWRAGHLAATAASFIPGPAGAIAGALDYSLTLNARNK